ncbi:MAG: amidohydrolase family protein [Planctomycetes bacterium]|nr:amidohydrolase family protein [Planctomycetota bacterium]
MPISRWAALVVAPFLAVLASEGLWQVSTAWTEAAQKQQADAPIVYRGARIHTASGPVIENGVMIVLKGKILDIGSEENIKIPKGAKVRDMTGKVIIPGLVDTHSHIGIFGRNPGGADGNEMTGPVQPGLRAIDAINPRDPGIRMALAGGVTTANIMPGSGNAIGGQTLYVRLKGNVVETMRILATRILGGIKFANGENPKGVYGAKGQAPHTRMKIAALQREMLTKAQAYKKQWDSFNKAKASGIYTTPPERDINLDPLVEVLEKKRTVHFHCHRADDIMTAVRLSEEFGFELVLQHCTEGYLVAEELAKRGISVSLTLVDSPGGKPEVMGLLEENAMILTKAGVKVAINTDDSVTESRFFLRTGAIAVRGGLSEDNALKALTLHGAQMLHLDDRLGSLEKGKDADFVVLSGKPFSVYTQVLETYIEGERVFDRNIHEDWTYQAGGFALPKNKDLLPTKYVPELQPLFLQGIKFGGGPLIVDIGPKQKPDKLAIVANRVYTVAGDPIDVGVVLVEKGKITKVFKGGQQNVPKGFEIVYAMAVTPGLIDAHSVVGLSGALNFKKGDQDQDEMSDPNQADLRVMDSFNPHEPLLQFIREHGVTVVHAMPGRANVIAGQTGIFRTHGRTVEQMKIRFPAGMLVNLGEVPKASYPGKLPSTRMGTANLIRTALQSAQSYAAKKPATPNLKHEALDLVLKKKMPIILSGHRADDLMTGLRIAKEYDLNAMLTLATEGYLISDAILDAKVPVIVHPTMQRASSPETFHGHLGNAAFLANRKIPTAICTAFEGYVPKTRVLRYEAAMAMVNGLGHDRALKSITLDAAKILGIDDRFGSIAVGKEADLVLYDGDPFEHSTHVTHTIIAGRVVHDRAEYLKLPFERRAMPLSANGGDYGCCLGSW